MRLRRETGDFQIRINPSNGTNAIRTGLSAEDFAGELININGTIEPVLSVSENEGVVTAKTASYTVTYNKETGAVTSSEGGAGGSGGGSGSGLVIECRYAPRTADSETNSMCFGESQPYSPRTVIEAGLTKEQLLNATFSVAYKGIQYDRDADAWGVLQEHVLVRPAQVRSPWIGDQYAQADDPSEILRRSYNIRLIAPSNDSEVSGDASLPKFDTFDAYYDPVTGMLVSDASYFDSDPA